MINSCIDIVVFEMRLNFSLLLLSKQMAQGRMSRMLSVQEGI